MEDVSSLVAELYAGHPYPPPIRDLDKATAEGGYQGGDPKLFAPLIWPEGRPPGRLKILSAGCGTQQAAWLAYANRDCDVFGVDISEASLAHARFLQDKHQLTNLRLFKGDLRESAAIGQDFDYIVCTGVLHHMADSDEGMRALVRVLAPAGVLFGMVYAAAHRAGVYMMQEAFRRMGVGPDVEGVAFARRTLAALPPWHYVHRYTKAATELQHDAGLVDTFLHPQDRAYSVPQVLALIEDNGLHFQGWLENNVYFPEGASWLAPDVGARIKQLSEREQWAVMELMRIANFAHYFFARRAPAPAISFADEQWRALVAHRLPWVQRLSATEFQRVGFKFALTPAESDAFDRADGKLTLGDLAANVQASVNMRALFERLWKQGHVMMTRPRSLKPALCGNATMPEHH